MISDDKRPSLTMGNIKALIRSIKDYVNKKLKDLDIDTSLYAKQSDMNAVQSVIPSNASASNKLVTASDTGLYAKQSDMNAVQAVIPTNASASNKLVTASDTGLYAKQSDMNAVQAVIPSDASASNQLVTNKVTVLPEVSLLSEANDVFADADGIKTGHIVQLTIYGLQISAAKSSKLGKFPSIPRPASAVFFIAADDEDTDFYPLYLNQYAELYTQDKEIPDGKIFRNCTITYISNE